MIRRYIDQLQIWSQETPDASVILAPGQPPLGYRGLWEHVEETVRTLRTGGIRSSDRIAVVLPNGPEMATCFLAVSTCATIAPLNPAYSESEFDFYLSDLSARALIVPAGIESAAIGVARRKGLAVIELTPVAGGGAGKFRLNQASAVSAAATFAEPEEVALVLHTSGTTSRPKIVPLTHANIAYSAQQIARSLDLSAADRCLNVMPLFHIHGLIGALLASVLSGGSVVCAPGFRSGDFLACLKEFRPSWYTAVPTIHQTILKLATENRSQIEGHGLRFIRSCSSALPPQLMADLETAFGVPMVEAYGMTEASHQMASNPLPPRARKPGSVGIAAGQEVAIMGEDGHLLGPGEAGEIVIRGPNVTGGYESNPAANEAAFTNGWFRTGDRGFADADGYIFIVGRIKEMINRGGEKISPREIDEVLRQHPCVAEALAFSLPHPTLGEDVAAAIVLREGSATTEREIRAFAAEKLAPFKVPRRIVIVKEIPKGPTGKPQRLGLAGKLGVTAVSATYAAPRTPLERTLAGIWRQVLGTEEIGIHDDFFQLGGDSIMATQVVSRLRDAEQLELPIAAFFDQPTIAGLGEALTNATAQAAGGPEG